MEDLSSGLGDHGRYTGFGKQMENPYQSPLPSSNTESGVPEHASFSHALISGVRTAIRWVTIIVAPILVLVFVGMQIALVYRGLTVGIWPEYSTPQFWFSMIVFALLLLGSYLVACFWGGLFAAVVYSLQHLFSRRHNSANGG